MSTFLPWCWLGMMAVHELGHVLGAWLSGGRVERVVLHPLAISRTDLLDNPHPLFVAWAGPISGVLLPLLLWLLWARLRWPASHLPRFFAGFCLVANGAYLAAGSFDGVGDAGDLLRHDCPHWTLWLFGLLCFPAGLWLWHGLAPRFGFGSDAQPVPAAHAWTCLALLLATVGLELSLQ